MTERWYACGENQTTGPSSAFTLFASSDSNASQWIETLNDRCCPLYFHPICEPTYGSFLAYFPLPFCIPYEHLVIAGMLLDHLNERSYYIKRLHRALFRRLVFLSFRRFSVSLSSPCRGTQLKTPKINRKISRGRRTTNEVELGIHSLRILFHGRQWLCGESELGHLVGIGHGRWID